MDRNKYDDLKLEIIKSDLDGQLIRSLSQKRMPMSNLMFNFCKRHELEFKAMLLDYINNDCLKKWEE